MSSFRSGSRSHRDRLLRELRTRMLCKYGLPECIPIIYKEIDTISGKPNISVEELTAIEDNIRTKYKSNTSFEGIRVPIKPLGEHLIELKNPLIGNKANFSMTRPYQSPPRLQSSSRRLPSAYIKHRGLRDRSLGTDRPSSRVYSNPNLNKTLTFYGNKGNMMGGNRGVSPLQAKYLISELRTKELDSSNKLTNRLRTPGEIELLVKKQRDVETMEKRSKSRGTTAALGVSGGNTPNISHRGLSIDRATMQLNKYDQQFKPYSQERNTSVIIPPAEDSEIVDVWGLMQRYDAHKYLQEEENKKQSIRSKKMELMSYIKSQMDQTRKIREQLRRNELEVEREQIKKIELLTKKEEEMKITKRREQLKTEINTISENRKVQELKKIREYNEFNEEQKNVDKLVETNRKLCESERKVRKEKSFELQKVLKEKFEEELERRNILKKVALNGDIEMLDQMAKREKVTSLKKKLEFQQRINSLERANKNSLGVNFKIKSMHELAKEQELKSAGEAKLINEAQEEAEKLKSESRKLKLRSIMDSNKKLMNEPKLDKVLFNDLQKEQGKLWKKQLISNIVEDQRKKERLHQNKQEYSEYLRDQMKEQNRQKKEGDIGMEGRAMDLNRKQLSKMGILTPPVYEQPVPIDNISDRDNNFDNN